MDNLTAARQKVWSSIDPWSQRKQLLPQVRAEPQAHGHVQWHVQSLPQWPLLPAEGSSRRILDRRSNKDSQWYEQHFRKVSKMITMLLRHNNDQEIRSLRRNRIQGDIVLIDFLQTDEAQLSDFTSLPPCRPWLTAW